MKIRDNKGKTLFRKGIRTKVYLAAVVIAVVLFLSAGVAYIEFSRMSEYVSAFIAKNVECINSSNELVELCEKFNQTILKEDDIPVGDSQMDSTVHKYIELIITNSTIDSENHYADSLRYAYAAYMQVVCGDEDLFFFDTYADKVTWYKENVEVVYGKLKGYLSTLSSLSQNVLSSNYDELSDRYYRSIMPAVLAIGASVVLIFLFVYFLTIYILGPVVKMHRGLKDYKDFNRPYKVTFDKGGDQIQELNDLIRDLSEDNNSLRNK